MFEIENIISELQNRIRTRNNGKPIVEMAIFRFGFERRKKTCRTKETLDTICCQESDATRSGQRF